MTDKAISAAASALGKLGGAKGGKAGRGASKRRGDSAYYRNLSKMRKAFMERIRSEPDAPWKP